MHKDPVDADDFVAQEKRKKCPKCPFQIICMQNMWPDYTVICARCRSVRVGYHVIVCTVSTAVGGVFQSTYGCPKCSNIVGSYEDGKLKTYIGVNIVDL